MVITDPGVVLNQGRDRTDASLDDMRRALIVETSLADVRLIASVLSPFRITLVRDFPKAKALMRAQRFDLLVTELKLREYNGLHLALLARNWRPAPVVLVVSATIDPVLRKEAELLEATFVPRPLSESEFRAAIMRSMARRDSRSAARQPGDEAPPTTLEAIRPPFERRQSERRTLEAPAPLERRSAERRAFSLAALTRAR
jgi:DNA-binding response OmpR family regulator